MKKKTLSLVCALVLAASLLLPLVASAMTWTAYVYTANGKSLNMRKAPVTHADNKIAGIPYGASVTILDYVNNRTWAYVNYNGKDGYVMSRYLTFDKPGPSPNPNPKPNPPPQRRRFLRNQLCRVSENRLYRAGAAFRSGRLCEPALGAFQKAGCVRACIRRTGA